jgi:hypothetical protein
MALSSVILRKWTSNGKYSVSSAYECQFLGSIINFPSIDAWKARTKQKCKFFSCLVLHSRVLTADNMLKRNWPCNQSYSFCLCMDETTPHLLTSCNYTEAVWNLIATRLQQFYVCPRGGGGSWMVAALLEPRLSFWKKGLKQGYSSLSCGWSGRKETIEFLNIWRTLLSRWLHLSWILFACRIWLGALLIS